MAVHTLRRLTAEQVAQYDRDGWLVVEDVYTAAEIARLGERADLIASGRAPHIPPERIQLEKVVRDGAVTPADQTMAVRKLYWLAGYDEVLLAHARHDGVVDIIADLLGTDDIKLYADQLFMKPPLIGAAQPWHQDSGSFKDHFPMDLVTAWAAIDHATTENGCLHFVPGSHKWGLLDRANLESFAGQIGTSTRYPAVGAPLRPGSVSFHHSLVLHASAPNTSGRRRRGYAVHYMRATTRIDPTVTDAPKVPQAISIRGRSFAGRV
ncbi:MAG: phytanoyl-CoA dioxygenase family protein [Actinobacteria bacterium]|nr:phytanoyl-CoA dioxygenase family protein [Actinomycetota bacterium]